MVSSDADHRSYQRRRPLQALRWRERRSCHLSLGSRCPACEEASVKVACRRVRGRRRPQRPVPGANDGALAANTQCQPAEARTSPPALARPSPDTNDEARSKSRTSPPALARPSPETNYEARLKSRTSPLKVEDVAARNGPPPVTNDEARVVVILVSKLECLERSATVVVLKVVVSSARDRTAPPVPGSIPPPATTLAEKEEERC